MSGKFIQQQKWYYLQSNVIEYYVIILTLLKHLKGKSNRKNKQDRGTGPSVASKAEATIIA